MSCNHTGIRGRVAIHELMEMTPGIKDGIMESVTTRELRQIALNDGMRSLRRNAILKMKAGLTTVEEVIGTTLKD